MDKHKQNLNAHKIPDKNQMKTVIIHWLICWFEHSMQLHRKLEVKSQATALKLRDNLKGIRENSMTDQNVNYYLRSMLY